MNPSKSNAQSEASKDARLPRLATPSPAAGVSQRSYVEDRPRAMDLVRIGHVAVPRERLAFLFGLVIRQIVDQPLGLSIVPNGEEVVEEARGAEMDGEAVEGREVEDMEQVERAPRRQARKRKNANLEKTRKPAKVLKLYQEVRFNKNVFMGWANRELALCGKRPYIFMAGPTFTTVQKLKRTEDRQPPRRFTREQIAAIAQSTDMETMATMEPNARPTGCAATCPEGCTPKCSCLMNDLKCSTSYGCKCKHPQCNNLKNGPIELLEHIRRKIAEVDLANEKTMDWEDAEANETIRSVGSIEDESMGEDVEMAEVESEAGESSDEEADVAMLEDEDEDEGFPEPTAMIEADPELDNSSPPMPDLNDTMRLSDDDSIPGPYDSPDDSDSSSSDDDDDELPHVNLEADQFSRSLLRLLPIVIDQPEVDSCDDGELLGGGALFVGLMKIATEINRNEGAQVAVAYPELFKKAVMMVREEDAGLEPERDVSSETISKNVVYGHDWTDLLIPMHVNNCHWAIAVVRRSLVSCTVYDSLTAPLSQGLSLAALRKLLSSLESMNPEDRTTSRFRLAYARPSCREIQPDPVSCGLMAVAHARRALQRTTRSAGQRLGDAPVDVSAERLLIRDELGRLMDWFQSEANAGRRWMHAAGTGQLRCRPAKTPVVLRWSGRRC